MAKIYGLFGSMTGKLADTVMSVRNGEQIARKYQPVVYNPSTPAQVEQRAKMKLMSQLSAVMAPFIAIRREGAKTSRNLFTKENFRFMTYANGTAEVVVESIQLTKSVVGLPTLTATRTGNSVDVALAQGVSNLDRVVYVAFFRQNDSSLRAAGSAVVTAAGTTNTFPATIDILTQDQLPVIVFAYGVRDNTEAAKVTFANMAVDAEIIASVVTSRRLTESDITLTETTSALASPQQAKSKKN